MSELCNKRNANYAFFALFLLLFCNCQAVRKVPVESFLPVILQLTGEPAINSSISLFNDSLELQNWVNMQGFSLEYPMAFPTNQALIVYYAGPRRSGGYQVQINHIEVKGRYITCDIIETKPGKECFVTNQITYPIVMAFIPKNKKRAILKSKLSYNVLDCN